MQPDTKTNAVSRSAHAVWLMAGGFVFMSAMSLEWLTATMHEVPVAAIHEHTIVPAGVHALAIASIPISLFPVFKGGSVRRWFLGTAAIIAALLLMGQALAAGLLAWVLSAALLVWQRRRQRNVTLQP